MRLARNKRKSSVLSLTSLIDVIFLLLLFFMLSTSFSRYVEMPIAASASGSTVSADQNSVETFVVELGGNEAKLNREVVLESEIINAIKNTPFDSAQIFLVAREGLSTETLIHTFQRLKGIEHARVSLLTDKDARNE